MSSGMLPRDPEELAVTSSLHPFWHTKRGGVVIGLVILVLIGAIVGGAVGGLKGRLDKRGIKPTGASTRTTMTSSQTKSYATNNSSMPGTTFSATNSLDVAINTPSIPTTISSSTAITTPNSV